jgi:hypothetical protein
MSAQPATLSMSYLLERESPALSATDERSDSCRNRGPSRAGVNRVHFHSACHGLMSVGVERPVTQSPKPTRKHWGPSRRHAPPGAHSTPAPATRDGVTARPIQPRRRASLATVAERRGRPMARPVSARRQMAGGRPTRRRALCTEIASPSGGVTRHTPLGAHVPSTNRSTPLGWNLAPVGRTERHIPLLGVSACATPNVRLGKPRRSRRGGCHSELSSPPRRCLSR